MIINNNSLFISLYNKTNHHICPSSCQQILSQTIKTNLLNIFIECEDVDKIYSDYFLVYHNYINLFFSQYGTKTINIKEMLSKYINKYSYFFFLDPTILLHHNFLQSLNNQKEYDLTNTDSFKVYGSNIKNKPVVGFNKNGIVNVLRQDLTMDYFSTITINSKIITNSISYYPINKENEQDIKYENELCIFCKIKEPKDSKLSDSYIYINKKNNKVYNINNNIVGDISIRGSIMEIIWSIKNEKQISIYSIK